MKRILVLCTGNSCRSQIAEGILRHLAQDKFEVVSAGTMPTRIHPLSVKAMAEIGIDISNHRSKSVREFEDQTFDYVITVCDSAKQSCPVFPGNSVKIHWSIKDPVGAQGSEADRLPAFRQTRDILYKKIQAFIGEFGQ